MDLELLTGTITRDSDEIYWELARNADAGPSDSRPVVVLSHGAGGSHAVWYQQALEIGQKYRVVTWDSQGFGNSTNNRPLDASNAANDLAKVLDHLDIGRAHLVGQSMGRVVYIGISTAIRRAVLSLTYANTVGALWTR